MSITWQVGPDLLRAKLNCARAATVWLAAVCILSVYAPRAFAECDSFIRWSETTLDDYQRDHRVYPVDATLQQLATKALPALWVTQGSWQPIDFGRYLASSTLYSSTTSVALAQGDAVRGAIAELTREEQCATWLEAPEQPASANAPVYVQVYRDDGPTGEQNWLYFKYTYVFDWSGLARKRSFISRIGAMLTGGNANKWHRLDVHTSAVVGIDANLNIRTLSVQQHNNKRTYVAGLDFEPSNLADAAHSDRTPLLHLAAAQSTNELYLDAGESTKQTRRAVATFLQWPFLIDETYRTGMWQMDEFRGRNAGGIKVDLHPEFIEPTHPLAAYAGLLAPKRRMLGVYVGRDGPPGYDFDGVSALPEATVIGFWREGDTELIDVLNANLNGFQSTDWTAIANHLRPKLRAALATTSNDRDQRTSQ